MPHWEGIEDFSAAPVKVWLGRRQRLEELKKAASVDDAKPPSSAAVETSDDIWKPLRKCDCEALNAAERNKTVFIEGGRATADPVSNLIFFNFFRGEQRELCSASWFVREEKTTKKDGVVLKPISHEQDSEKIEALYQKAVSATSSLGKGIDSVLSDEVTLCDSSKVKIRLSGGTLTVQRTPPGWFSSSTMLQRGYGAYTVDGEEEEITLGPVRHVVFVVHGIGEAMFTRDDVSLPSMIEQMNATRTAVQKRQVKEWKRLCEKARKEHKSLPPPPNRIEFLPIEWFNRLHDSSSELMKTLKAVSLPSIPALRAIANDIIFDVLLYLTPDFCQAVLETVTEQINDLYGSFQKVHPDFLRSGGECSLIGHSLGTVILWDILSILKDSKESKNSKFSGFTFPCFTFTDEDIGYHAYAKKEHANEPRYGTWGPALTKKIQQTIPFTPKCTIFLGSPLGMFLTLRGAHPVFESIWKQSVAKAQEAASCGLGHEEKDVNLPKASPFSLPTGSLYNIFNFSDPVAYRIEPLLLPQSTKPCDIPPPAYLTAPGKDVRLHVKAMQIGDELRRNMAEQKMVSFSSIVGSAVSMLSAAAAIEADPEATARDQTRREGILSFPLGGKSYRVDYSFQPSVIDNEYISAVLAHSTSGYFLHEDLLDLMINQFAPPSKGE